MLSVCEALCKFVESLDPPIIPHSRHLECINARNDPETSMRVSYPPLPLSLPLPLSPLSLPPSLSPPSHSLPSSLPPSLPPSLSLSLTPSHSLPPSLPLPLSLHPLIISFDLVFRSFAVFPIVICIHFNTLYHFSIVFWIIPKTISSLLMI